MGFRHPDHLTTLLERLDDDYRGAFTELVEAVYDRLHDSASNALKDVYGPRLGGLTIQPTLLADDVVMRLIEQHERWQNTQHFYAIATQLMLRVLTDYQRNRLAQKRGGRWRRREVDENDIRTGAADRELEARDDVDALLAAVIRLSELHPRKAEVFTLHFECNMPLAVVARKLSISTATADRDWRFVRAFLNREIEGSDEDDA